MSGILALNQRVRFIILLSLPRQTSYLVDSVRHLAGMNWPAGTLQQVSKQHNVLVIATNILATVIALSLTYY